MHHHARDHLLEASVAVYLGKFDAAGELRKAMDYYLELVQARNMAAYNYTTLVAQLLNLKTQHDQVYDTIQHLRAPVSTYCVGMAASMGAVLVAAGAKGKRAALPNSRIMIHQPSGGSQGTAADIEIAAREILEARQRLNRILAKHTGQTPEQIAEDIDRDRFMSPEEALAYGLIDRVLTARDNGTKPASTLMVDDGPSGGS